MLHDLWHKCFVCEREIFMFQSDVDDIESDSDF